ncbi:MAG: PAS domain S-box protein [Anaeromyxobacteraceae bacterium]
MSILDFRPAGPQRDRETPYQTLFDAIDEGLFLIDVLFDDHDRPIDLLYVGANAAATRMVGRDFTGKRLREIDPGYEEYWYEIFGKVALTGESVRLERYAAPDRRWYGFFVFRLGGPESRRVGALFRDVTERKRAVEALRESEEKHRAAFAQATIGFALATPEGRFLDANPAYCAITGYTLDELRTKTIPELLFADDRACLVEIERLLAGAIPAFVIESRYRRKPGDSVWVRKSVSLVRDALGASRWIVGLVEDISDRKRSEDALRASEARQAYLVRLGDRLRDLADAEEIQAGACRLLVEQLGVDRAFYVELDEQAGTTHVARDHVVPGVPSLVGTRPLDDYGWVMPLLRRGESVAMADVASDARIPEADRPALAAVQIAAHVSVPVIKGSALLGALCVTTSRPRPWGELDVALVRETAERLSASILRARSETALRIAEARLRETNERFTAAVEASPVVVFTQDLDLRYTWIANPALGFRSEDVAGKTDHDLFERPEDAEGLIALKRRALQTGEAVREIRPVQDRGVMRWFDLHVRPQQRDGVVIGIIATAVDVTEHKLVQDRAADREAALRLAMTASLALVFEWDIERDRVTRALSMEEALPAEGDRGRTLQEVADIVHPADRNLFLASVRSALESPDGAYRSEHRIVRPDGEVRRLQESGRVEFDTGHRPVRLLGVSMDVTDLRRAGEDLRAANEQLRAEGRRKSEFLAVLSHELRNPLAPIRNSAALLERTPPDSDQARRAREIIHRQADHLTRLVDDLLDMTRITHGKIELRKTRLDAREVVSRACEDARAGFDQRGVKLRYIDPAEPLWVEADTARLAQMVGNLLANALKFTPPGGAVDVVAERRGDTCETTVRDTGIGIAPEDLERIFGAFEQAVAVRRAHGGLGIGLALVRDLAERHGGSVRAHSDGPGTGASFVLALPLAAAPRREAQGRIGAAAAQPLSILIVEDNVDAATTLADLLALGGHEVETVHTGREGIERARRRPQALLCDIGLPDLTGHEVIQAIRTQPGGGDIFAIALTGFAQPEDRAAALAAGFDAHMSKPPSLEELEALLARVAGTRSMDARMSP